MNKFLFLTALLAMALMLGTIGGGIWFGAAGIRQLLDVLDPRSAIVLGVASVVALLGALVIAVAIRSAKQTEIDSRRQSERAHIFVAVMDVLAARLRGAIPVVPDDLGQPEERSIPEMALFLKGSETVVKEYRTVLSLLSQPRPEAPGIRKQVSRLLLAMRRDCGSSALRLENDDWSDLLNRAATLPVASTDLGDVQVIDSLVRHA